MTFTPNSSNVAPTPASSLASRSEFLRIRGLRLHVRHWGAVDKPKLILLTGWLDVSASFQFLAESLLSHWHVICPDWRGFGLSEHTSQGYWIQDYVADLDALFDHWRALDATPTPLNLVGHSLGSQVASLYAGLRPERIRKLVLLDGPFVPDQGAEQAPRRYKAWLDALKKEPEDRRYESFEDLAKRVIRTHPSLTPARALFVARCWGREEVRDGHAGVWMRADPQHRLPWPILHRTADSMAIWQGITAPVLSIDGGKSRLRPLPEDEITRRRRAFADHRVVTIAEGGHMLHLDAPEATSAAIHTFLDAG